ncbi:Cyt-b5 domain-containing protein [Rhizoctonia solani AG-1 IA]|uniref:Cyt-b5 domain-containing protein n=1 Tax=Thanatephorus cucumeris (strain AG1-IA) TaxID=983506 RepID=L8X9C2_THACA|nr:Cyt-b5 domain-containing protein [Rhizoctonia solani AG-1 IA]
MRHSLIGQFRSQIAQYLSAHRIIGATDHDPISCTPHSLHFYDPHVRQDHSRPAQRAHQEGQLLCSYPRQSLRRDQVFGRGDEVIMAEGGKDATEAFEDVGHSDEARDILKGLYVADFEGGPVNSS